MTGQFYEVTLESQQLSQLIGLISEEEQGNALVGLYLNWDIPARDKELITRIGVEKNRVTTVAVNYGPYSPSEIRGSVTLPEAIVIQLATASVALKEFFDYQLEGQRKIFKEKLEKQREQTRREEFKNYVLSLVTVGNSDKALEAYREGACDWWGIDDFQNAIEEELLAQNLSILLKFGNINEIDFYFNNKLDGLISAKALALLKVHNVRERLINLGLDLDDEQLIAIASPLNRLLIAARAGSGKTKTLSARAALAIQDEKLDPNQVLILAFNKAASIEIKERVEKLLNGSEYRNARTFHSLAHQLAKPTSKILFDQGEEISTREQSMFAQRMLRRIINPAFQAEMVQFFRKELEEIEVIGRDLPPEDYFVFRRALEHVTLGGQWIRPDGTQIKTNGERVKSKGEKYIADFLFEHDIPYKYERAWMWKAPFLKGATYKPDFSFIANGYDIILEHWAFDPSNPNATLPSHWRQSAEDYREQIESKREFWASKGIKLIETHSGMLSGGREEFEKRLKEILEGVGIECTKLPENEIVRRVFQNDFMLSRMAGLFIQFISRAKKRGWSPDAVAKMLKQNSKQEPRTKSFQRLALRAFREYELMKEEESAMDFDDLLTAATKVVQQHGSKATIHLGHGRHFEVGNLKWILLDEYQDFSPLYYGMLKAILDACPNIRLVAVGDDWQAINSFAGAELDFFKQFDSYFPGGERTSITTNYRSGKHIVQSGNAVMFGRGQLAQEAPKAEIGEIEIRPVTNTFVQFMRTPQTEDEWRQDQIYLPEGTNGKASEYVLRQAQVFKICTQILKPSLASDKILETAKGAGRLPHVLFLSRTGYAYGLDLADFKSKMVEILVAATGSDEKLLNRLVHVSTAHGSKGREANTVIVLDATEKQFPKIHPDNLLFEIFGVTQKDVLEEERRLFYVAISRAVQRLVILTDREKESPYLKLIPHCADFRVKNNEKSPAYSPTTPFERRIFKQIGMPIEEQTKGVDSNLPQYGPKSATREVVIDFELPY